MFLLLKLGIYALVFTLGIGLFIYLNRQLILRFFQESSWPTALLFFLSAYALVILEESIVGVANALEEWHTLGVSFFSLALIRAAQFSFFNIIAFSGLILGLFLATRYARYSGKELFIFAGLYSFLSERTIQYALTPGTYADIYVFSLHLFYAILSFFSYGVILSLSILTTLARDGDKKRPRLVRYALAIVLPLLCATVFLYILSYVQMHYPGLLPPLQYTT